MEMNLKKNKYEIIFIPRGDKDLSNAVTGEIHSDEFTHEQIEGFAHKICPDGNYVHSIKCNGEVIKKFKHPKLAYKKPQVLAESTAFRRNKCVK